MGLMGASLWAPLESLPSGVTRSPAFLSWLEYVGEDGRELLLAALKERNGGADASKAEAFLLELFEECRKVQKDSLFVSLSDFGGRKSRALFVLRKALGIVSDRDMGLADRRYGVVSHIVVPLLLEGKLPALWMGDDNLFTTDAAQLSVFGDDASGRESEAVQAELELPEFDAVSDWPSLAKVRRLRDLPEVILTDLERVVSSTRAELAVGKGWQERYEVTRKMRPLLVKMLRPILDGYLDKLPRFEDPWADHLLTLTLLTWAYAVVYAARSRSERIFFKEISAFNKARGLSGGRIDALEVVSAGGRMVFHEARKFLLNLSRQRFTSVSHLVEDIEKHIGDVYISLSDWKFGIGDFNGNVDLVSPDLCPEPGHVEQMERYLSLAPLDWYLHKGKSDGKIWVREHSHIVEARLTFFLPTHDVFEHSVLRSEKEREAIFDSHFASRWQNAERRSYNRSLTNAIMPGIVKGLATGTATGHNSALFNDRRSVLQLFEPDPGPLREIVQQHRQFVDKFGIVERLFRHNGEVLALHFDLLLKAIDNGSVRYLTFDSKTGGRVACLNPSHDDKHPDMAVTVSRGSFHCFACGFSGVIVPGSLTDEQVALRERSAGHGWSPEDIVVPDECHALLERAHAYMQKAFMGSAAEEYISGARGLSPDTAYEHGAGYGSDRLIIQLVEEEHTLDTLLEHGLLGYSPKIREESVLVRMLIDYGYSLSEIERPITVRKGGVEETVRGLPYSVLRDRVTFPLFLEDRFTNFYGRAIGEVSKHLKHRKLRVKPKGITVKQGGFNMAALGKHDAVLVTEAPLDALTLIEMGHPNAVAIIGTSNWNVLSAVARKAKVIRLAYNHDGAGHLASGRAIKFLLEQGFTAPDFGNVHDFTREFFRGHDTAAKDYNQWWSDEKGNKT